MTRKSYLNSNNVDEEDLDAEQESDLPQLFQVLMVEMWVASVMIEIEIDDTCDGCPRMNARRTRP